MPKTAKQVRRGPSGASSAPASPATIRNAPIVPRDDAGAANSAVHLSDIASLTSIPFDELLVSALALGPVVAVLNTAATKVFKNRLASCATEAVRDPETGADMLRWMARVSVDRAELRQLRHRFYREIEASDPDSDAWRNIVVDIGRA